MNAFKTTLPTVCQISGAMRFIILNGNQDTYVPCVSLVKKCFPNAKLIIDCFHIIHHIGRTFRNHRIIWTKRLSKSSSLAEKR
ncbi:transposase [Enterococcus faecalis]|nr:transposase [Enterococcus faecalis]